MERVEAPPVQQRPVMPYEQYQAYVDNDQLRLLSVLSQVYGVITFVLTSLCLVYVAFGIAVMNSSAWMGPKDSAPPAFFGSFMIFIGSIGFILGCLHAGLTLYAGKCIRARQNWTWVMVAACFDCLNMPLGTALGVFTLIVINRPSVKAQFAEFSAPQLG